MVTVGTETEVLTPPKHKDVDIQQVVDLRRLFKKVVRSSASTKQRSTPPLRRPDSFRSMFSPTYPHTRLRKVHHTDGNPRGTYEADNSAYWREVTDALASAAAILCRARRG